MLSVILWPGRFEEEESLVFWHYEGFCVLGGWGSADVCHVLSSWYGFNRQWGWHGNGEEQEAEGEWLCFEHSRGWCWQCESGGLPPYRSSSKLKGFHKAWTNPARHTTYAFYPKAFASKSPKSCWFP